MLGNSLPVTDPEAFAAMIGELAEQAVLNTLSPCNSSESTRPNMSPLAEALRDYQSIRKNIKVLSWKLSQLESQALLDNNSDWCVRRSACEVVEHFADQFQPFSRQDSLDWPCRHSWSQLASRGQSAYAQSMGVDLYHPVVVESGDSESGESGLWYWLRMWHRTSDLSAGELQCGAAGYRSLKRVRTGQKLA